jgi:Domain of unknown function (DUF4123)
MTYILYDTALNGPYTLMLLQNAYPVNLSLFKGTKDEVLSDVAPYLFLVDEKLFEKVNDPIASLEAIVVMESELKINDLLAHFQQFIYEKINGKENYFRFWDARVLARFLPVCNDEKRTDFFDGINCYYTIDRQLANAGKYSVKRGKIQTADIVLNKLFLPNEKELQFVHSENQAAIENKQPEKEKRKYFN